MNDYFELDAEDGIAHLRLNRPERMNTLAPAFFPLLRDSVQGLSDAGETRVLVISSTGKHFSAARPPEGAEAPHGGCERSELGVVTSAPEWRSMCSRGRAWPWKPAPRARA